MNVGMSENLTDKRLASTCGTTIVSYLAAQSPVLAKHLVDLCLSLKSLGYSQVVINFDIETDITPTASIDFTRLINGSRLISIAQGYHLKHTMKSNNMFSLVKRANGNKSFMITEHHWPAFLNIIESLGMSVRAISY